MYSLFYSGEALQFTVKTAENDKQNTCSVPAEDPSRCSLSAGLLSSSGSDSGDCPYVDGGPTGHGETSLSAKNAVHQQAEDGKAGNDY